MTKQAPIYASGLYFVFVLSAPTVIWLFFHNHLVVLIFFFFIPEFDSFFHCRWAFLFSLENISPIAYKCTYTVFILFYFFFPHTFITWSFSLFLFTLLCLWLRSWLLKHQNILALIFILLVTCKAKPYG